MWLQKTSEQLSRLRRRLETTTSEKDRHFIEGQIQGLEFVFAVFYAEQER